jgi:hypothetical protein
MSLKHAGTDISKFMHEGSEVGMLIYRGAQIYPDPRLGDMLVARTRYRMFEETDATWFEVGWLSVGTLTGNAVDGWEDPDGFCRIKAIQSDDLVTWNDGMFVDSPVEAEEDVGSGNFVYWARSIVPFIWNSVKVDFHLSCARHAKSIEEIQLLGYPISLPNYPYSMPADAATLQADLRAAGYSGAVVSVTTAALTATVKNYTDSGTQSGSATMSGTNVTAVAIRGTAVSLASYPYAMPSQRASLQADLRTAGYDGAVVTLFDDLWEIHLPDVLCGSNRPFFLTISPSDPHPVWDFFGNPQADYPQTEIKGDHDNVRTPSGDPLNENPVRQFARFAIELGARYDA